jgi:hypothetical protein
VGLYGGLVPPRATRPLWPGLPRATGGPRRDRMPPAARGLLFTPRRRGACYFTPPAVRPAMIRRWKMSTMMTSGTVTITPAAI